VFAVEENQIICTFYKVVGFVDKSLRSDKNWEFLDFYLQIESTKQTFWRPKVKSNPRNKSFEQSRMKRIQKNTFWTFANPKLRICMDSDLFIVSLCTKDSWGFVRIHWIHENWLNLFKIGLLFKSTNETKENIKDLSHNTNSKSGFVL
jgi:hypothetical protein